MVLLTIISVANVGFALILTALIIWFLASRSLKKILLGSESNEAPISGSISNIDGKKVISLSQGFDINLEGKANKIINHSFAPKTFGIKPEDFTGFQPIPKMMVKEGETVKAGDKLFYDRKMEGTFITAPVSGTIKEIRRGTKRRIDAIVIDADAKTSFKKFDVNANGTREEVLNTIVESGCLASFISRPFGYPALPTQNPKAIFISAFDTAPLAADNDFIIENFSANDFQTGLDVINKLTKKVHLNVSVNSNKVFQEAKGVQVNYFEGQDPAGKVGIQIHHIDAIKAGEVVWTIRPTDVVTIGRLFNEGIYDPQEVIAVAGTPLEKTFYVKTRKGACIDGLVGDLSEKENRFVSGNALTGTSVRKNSFVGFSDNLITVLKEGTQEELFGWFMPHFARPSISGTFPWTGNKEVAFEADTNMHGEPRAFVVTGQYEQVLPMDIFPVHLLKSILVKDFEQMEGLGIYELLEEDLALCEFVCTSKQPVQQILREGLDYIYSQG